MLIHIDLVKKEVNEIIHDEVHEPASKKRKLSCSSANTEWLSVSSNKSSNDWDIKHPNNINGLFLEENDILFSQ